MKVFLHYEEPEDESEKLTIKLSLPKTWKNGPFSQLQDIFIDNFNKKHRKDAEDEKKLNSSDFHLETKQRVQLATDATVKDYIEDGEDIFLKSGPSKTKQQLGIIDKQPEEPEQQQQQETITTQILPPTESELITSSQPLINTSSSDKKDKEQLLCKNFGCQKRYLEKENNDKACQHHSKPPIFHETRKYWACCPDKVAWDWETFTAIPGCQLSFHIDKRKEGKSFLGGTDVRAEVEENTPQRIDNKPKVKSDLEKISELRKALVNVGVSGQLFDECRDRIKEEIYKQDETIGSKVWEGVLKKIAMKIENSFQ